MRNSMSVWDEPINRHVFQCETKKLECDNNAENTGEPCVDFPQSKLSCSPADPDLYFNATSPSWLLTPP